MLKRRNLFTAVGVTLVVAIPLTYAITHAGSGGSSESTRTAAAVESEETRPEITVWKSPTCGCCKDWVSYLESEGFPVTAHNTDNMNSIKARLGLPGPELASCHTATVEGYIVEGHVPVSDIERLLAERPDIAGISAPGMPMMSPGMGSIEPQDYDVLSFDEAGNQAIFSSY